MGCARIKSKKEKNQRAKLRKKRPCQDCYLHALNPEIKSRHASSVMMSKLEIHFARAREKRVTTCGKVSKTTTVFCIQKVTGGI